MSVQAVSISVIPNPLQKYAQSADQQGNANEALDSKSEVVGFLRSAIDELGAYKVLELLANSQLSMSAPVIASGQEPLAPVLAFPPDAKTLKITPALSPEPLWKKERIDSTLIENGFEFKDK